ncbi:hypothetical protein GCM10023148_35180 [Actinokineospora soli]
MQLGVFRVPDGAGDPVGEQGFERAGLGGGDRLGVHSGRFLGGGEVSQRGRARVGGGDDQAALGLPLDVRAEAVEQVGPERAGVI